MCARDACVRVYVTQHNQLFSVHCSLFNTSYSLTRYTITNYSTVHYAYGVCSCSLYRTVGHRPPPYITYMYNHLHRSSHLFYGNATAYTAQTSDANNVARPSHRWRLVARKDRTMIYEWAMNSTYGSALHATACSSGCESWLCWLGLGLGLGLGVRG